MTFTLRSIDDKPERDPYRNDGSSSTTVLTIDPQERAAWVTQDYRANSTAMSYYLHHRYALLIAGHPRAERIRAWFEQERIQKMLGDIADGHVIEWDGHNYTGRLTEDAWIQLDVLREELDVIFDGYSDNWQYWDVADWIDDYMRVHVHAKTSYEQLNLMANDLEHEAKAGGIILSDSPLPTLVYYRDSL